MVCLSALSESEARLCEESFTDLNQGSQCLRRPPCEPAHRHVQMMKWLNTTESFADNYGHNEKWRQDWLLEKVLFSEEDWNYRHLPAKPASPIPHDASDRYESWDFLPIPWSKKKDKKWEKLRRRKRKREKGGGVHKHTVRRETARLEDLCIWGKFHRHKRIYVNIDLLQQFEKDFLFLLPFSQCVSIWLYTEAMLILSDSQAVKNPLYLNGALVSN